jgi:GDP-4-dehydro-6-deoxy-D-mannose reductase
LPATLACGSFVDAVARLERTTATEPLRTGTLSSARDFTDIRDVVRAYVAIAERGRPGRAYNVCAGTAVPLRHCLDVLLELAARHITTELDPVLVQADDIDIQVGDAARLRALTDWRPLIPVDQSLADMLAHRRREGRP